MVLAGDVCHPLFLYNTEGICVKRFLKQKEKRLMKKEMQYYGIF